jgi:uncharacterized protein
MQQPLLPTHIKMIGADMDFSFLCSPDIPCFTHCCRQLELALTPYDVLRLKKATGLKSSDFLETYVIIEQEKNDIFPRLYLTMVDDGMASCVFVSEQGCTVYNDRPGACRAYPVGRAATLNDGNTVEEFFVLLEERHCQGFCRNQQQTPKQYFREQGLSSYNRFSDAVMTILQHKRIRQGMILSEDQIEAYILALYNLDTFRTMMLNGHLPDVAPDATRKLESEEDESLLLFAIDWLKNTLFCR